MSKLTPAIPLQQLSDALKDVVAQAAQSVVAVHATRSRSSGFVWRPGLIVTADEALDEEGDIAVVLPGGEMASASLVGRDPTTDVALLRIDRGSAGRCSRMGCRFSAWSIDRGIRYNLVRRRSMAQLSRRRDRCKNRA